MHNIENIYWCENDIALGHLFLDLALPKWNKQVDKMNEEVCKHYKKERRTRVALFSYKEFLVTTDILITAVGYNCKGCELWKQEEGDSEQTWKSIVLLPDFGKYMGCNRYK